jgi:hypothetical protein
MDVKETGYEIIVWNHVAQDQVRLLVFVKLPVAQITAIHVQGVFKILKQLSDSVNNYTVTLYIF